MNTRIVLGILLLLIGIVLPISPALAQYEPYIDNLPKPVSITSGTVDIQQELEAKVQEMVNLGHMAPVLYHIGTGGTFAFYIDPSETIYALSVAYPYLSGSLKTKVKTYLDNEIKDYPPHSNGYYRPYSGKISDMKGARREYYVPNPDQPFNFWYEDPPGSGNWVPPSVHVSVLYSVWIYSYNTGDWNYATNNYNLLKSIYTKFRDSGTLASYPELAGVIGFARIAKQLGNMADYNDAVVFAEQGFTNGIDFNQFLTTGKARYPMHCCGGTSGFTTPIFMVGRNPVRIHFNRDIGLFLRDHIASGARNYVDELDNELPFSWLTGVGMGGIRYANNQEVSHGENFYSTPEIAWTYFMIHAYVLGDSVDQLKRMLDKPDMKGDLLYIQKLVATIEAGAGFASGDVNHDGSVNKDDVLLILTNFSRNPADIPGYYDPVGDNKVNGLDFGYVVRDWGR